MIGLFNVCRALTGLILLILVIAYVAKFVYFKQPLDTWDSWRFDDEFFTVAPFVIGGTILVVLFHYGCMLGLKCLPVCYRRQGDYVELRNSGV
jgi:hypothetical protein